MTTRPDEPSHTNLEAGLGNSPPDLEGVGPGHTDLEAEPTKERTPYVPDNQSMRVLLGALGVGAVVAVAVVVLLVTFG